MGRFLSVCWRRLDRGVGADDISAAHQQQPAWFLSRRAQQTFGPRPASSRLGVERLFIGAGVEGFDLAADRTGMGSKRGLVEIALGTRLVIEVAVAVDAAQTPRTRVAESRTSV